MKGRWKLWIGIAIVLQILVVLVSGIENIHLNKPVTCLDWELTILIGIIILMLCLLQVLSIVASCSKGGLANGTFNDIFLYDMTYKQMWVSHKYFIFLAPFLLIIFLVKILNNWADNKL